MISITDVNEVISYNNDISTEFEIINECSDYVKVDQAGFATIQEDELERIDTLWTLAWIVFSLIIMEITCGFCIIIVG